MILRQHSVFLPVPPCQYPPPPGTKATFLIRSDNGFLEQLHEHVPNDTTMLMLAARPGQAGLNDRMRDDFERGMRASGFTHLRAHAGPAQQG